MLYVALEAGNRLWYTGMGLVPERMCVVQMEIMKKLTRYVNMGLMGFVLIMMAVFAHYGVNYMVYHSIPTLAVYVALYYVIHKDRLDLYVWIVYTVITIYMVAATICLGYNYGFHLYCTSLIPLAFYMEYLAHKLGTRKTSALLTSLILVGVYLTTSGYVVLRGPVYEINENFASLCLIINAASTFCFLIGYSQLIHKLVRHSENQLSEMAHKDQLTGLFNRPYVMTYMDELYQQSPANRWVAMIDIDGFKGINDCYGHRGGDYVLTEMARMMQEACGDCVIARWGGEDFLVVSSDEGQDAAMMEALRGKIDETRFVFQEQEIPVSITVGVSSYQAGQSLDDWIQSADRKLYIGKNSGKNQVVY